MAKAAPEGKKVRLIAVDTGDGTFLRNALKPFLEKNPSIEVEIVAVAWAQYDEKVDLLVAGGEAPALWWPGAKRGYRYYAIRDMFPDLTPYIQRDKYDTNDFFEPTWKYVHWQGKPVAFPSQHHLAPYIFFNKTLFDQAGVQYPPTTWEDTSWTWDRFLELAKALSLRARVIVLDEPTNGLDPAGIVEIRALLRSLAAQGKAIFLSSHQLNEVQLICDRVAIVHSGRIVASGAVADLLRQERVI
ncbi:MAG: hypothetical protein C4345_01525, partial [Chloroflexota bacterium]